VILVGFSRAGHRFSHPELRTFLRRLPSHVAVSSRSFKRPRPDVDAAVRGGDWAQAMDGEMLAGQATMKEARYWRQIYTEIVTMEELVLDRIRQLMLTQGTEVRREVELTNVPVVAAQLERFRKRLGYWDDRIRELEAKTAPK